MFIFGQVTPAGGILKINGSETPVYQTGAYLAYVPVAPGKFDFILDYKVNDKQYKYKRSVFIKGFDYRLYENKYRFDTSSVFPSTDLSVTTSDIIDFTIAGSPGRTVKMTLGPDFKDIQMPESPKEPGVYKTTLTFSDETAVKRPLRVSYTMHDANGKEKGRASSKGKVKVINIDDLAVFAKVKKENIRIRPGPQPRGYMPDTKLFGKVEVTGIMNNLYRVQLDDTEFGWTEKSNLDAGAHISVPKNIAWEISAVSQKEKTTLTIKNTEKVPFKIEQTPKSFTVVLFYTQALNTIMSDTHGELISSMDYEIATPRTKKIIANFLPGKELWGYSYEYDGNNLVFELYHKPQFAFTKKQPLKDLKILLDPGHSPKRTPPYDGAVGPTGVLEYEANYKIAKATAKKLEKLGATVIMSKTEAEQLNLIGRSKKALKDQVHLFLSIHNNALPDNVNPFSRERGFSMYYYYNHSIPLATAMERSYIKRVGLPSDGLIQADLSVTRNLPHMPAILIENVYLMFPIHEELIKQDKFIDTLAEAVSQGVLGYINPAAADTKTNIVTVGKKD